ncbi:MAG: PEP-CTERM sorting domain-containing protein [Cyanobacteria bacterium P01_H01_bin.35]
MFKNLKTTGIGCFATLAMLLVGSTEAKAATITLDAEIYTSDVNTCSSPLTKGECFMEKGFNVAAFGAGKIGTDEAFFSEHGHFHARDSYEAQHFSDSGDPTDLRLLGLFITAKNGGEFNLESLDYQLRRNERAIDGYTTDDTKILISTTFDPTMPVLGQFTEYSIGNDTSLPFETLSLEGFENITQVFISSSGDVNFDNIYLNSVPEPTSILGLLALGTFGGASILKRKQK